ncbi:hypothetical protein HD554DRAFT_1820721 [Boletus coccyginus]|nr:hypothetical protein HD554DRAFT_1820721 [Boletus coccyginus]
MRVKRVGRGEASCSAKPIYRVGTRPGTAGKTHRSFNRALRLLSEIPSALFRCHAVPTVEHSTVGTVGLLFAIHEGFDKRHRVHAFPILDDYSKTKHSKQTLNENQCIQSLSASRCPKDQRSTLRSAPPQTPPLQPVSRGGTHFLYEETKS